MPHELKQAIEQVLTEWATNTTGIIPLRLADALDKLATTYMPVKGRL